MFGNLLVCVDGDNVHVLVDKRGDGAAAYVADGDGNYRQVECRVARQTNKSVSAFFRNLRQKDKHKRITKKTRSQDLAWAVQWGYLLLPDAVRLHLIHQGVNPDKINMNKLVAVCIDAIKLFLAGMPNKPLDQDLWEETIIASRIMSWFDLFEFAKFDVCGDKK